MRDAFFSCSSPFYNLANMKKDAVFKGSDWASTIQAYPEGEMFLVDGTYNTYEANDEIENMLITVYGEEFRDEITTAIENYNNFNTNVNDSIMYGVAYAENTKTDILLSHYNNITLDCCTLGYYVLTDTVIIKEFNKYNSCAPGSASKNLLTFLNTHFKGYRITAQATTDEVGRKVYKKMLGFEEVGDKRLYVKYF